MKEDNRMSANDEQVKHLDSERFGEVIKDFENGIKEYERIIDGVKTSTTKLFLFWQGEGKKQFEKDYTKIYRQLEDVSDVLYDLRDALVDAQAAYIKTDEEIAKLASTQS